MRRDRERARNKQTEQNKKKQQAPRPTHRLILGWVDKQRPYCTRLESGSRGRRQRRSGRRGLDEGGEGGEGGERGERGEGGEGSEGGGNTEGSAIATAAAVTTCHGVL